VPDCGSIYPPAAADVFVRSPRRYRMELPYGEGTIEVDLAGYDATVARPPGGEQVAPRAAADRALEDPHGPPLDEIADRDDDVAIVVTDLTRDTPDVALLDALFERLPVRREGVEVVVGLGFHRPMTGGELRAELGEYAALARNHDPDEAVEVGTVDGPGTPPGGVPVEVDPRVAEADLVVGVGLVEPHQYAGFSGGAKTVVIGAGGEPLIGYTHGPELLADPGVRLGRTDGNPFREVVDRAGDTAGVGFCLNVARGGTDTRSAGEGPDGVLGAAAGRPRGVVEDLAATAREALSASAGNGYDAVVAGLGAPKDSNLYQASRAATYVLLGPHNPLRPGGRVVIPARLEEGAGRGTGERRFHERLAGASDAGSLYERLRGGGYPPGAQRAFVLARALRDHEVVVTDSEHPEIVEECLLTAAPTVGDALEPGSRVLVVPDAIGTLLVGPD